MLAVHSFGINKVSQETKETLHSLISRPDFEIRNALIRPVEQAKIYNLYDNQIKESDRKS